MKNHLTITLFLFLSISLFGQELIKSDTPKNYLGKWNNQHIYTTGLSHVRSNTLILYQFEESSLSPLKTIQLEKDIFEQVFLFENEVYAILSDKEEKFYHLVKYDSEFNEIERLELMTFNDNHQNFGQKYIQGTKHLTRFIVHEGKVLFYVSENLIRMSVIDLKLMKSNMYTIDVTLVNSLIPTDALFFNETDAHVVFDYKGEFEYKRFYYVLLDGKTSSFELNSFNENSPKGVEASSFKFIKIKDKNYLMSIAFLGRITGKYVGFTFNEIKEENIKDLSLNVFINDKLDNPEIWFKKEYKKWKKNKLINQCTNPELNEIYFKDDRVVTTVLFEPKDCVKQNILVSSMNVENPDNPFFEWNVFTHNGLQNGTRYNYYQHSYTYFSVLTDKHIKVFYNCKATAVLPDGSVKKYKKEVNPIASSVYPETRIVILNISLDDGSWNYEPYKYLTDNSYPKKIINPFYFIDFNMINFVTEFTPMYFEAYPQGEFKSRAVSIPYIE